jgi:RHS repeat-associated protein
MVHTDAEGNQTTYTYDLAGRKASETFGGETVLYFYDSMGRQNKTQKGDLLTITEYDSLDRVTEERNESSSGEVLRKVQYGYDDTGNRKTVTRFVAGGEATEINLYDPLNRLIEKTNAQGFVETISYKDVTNAYGQKVLQKTHTDAMGLQTIETYDAHNRVARIEKRKENTLSICEKFHSPRGPPSFQIDTVFSPDNTSRQIRTRWDYNSRGRLETLTEAEGTLNAKITRYTYTPRGELEHLHKPDGTVVTYTYNGLGQLESISSSDRTVQHQMTYNLLGHLQTSDQLTRTTDPKGRLLSETFPQGYVVSSCYDSTGRRSSCEIPAANCLIEYGYNATDLKEVSRKTLDSTTLYSHNHLSHDLSGNLLTARAINGDSVEYSVDTLSRKTAIATPAFAQEILKFDPVGNIRQMKIQQESITYDYDDLYQLTSESGPFAHNYLYDTLYNRLQKDAEAYEINALNQVTSHLEYNLNGTPIRQDDTIYTYDALDRLIKIETPILTQTFQYDSFHRCVSKTTNQQTQYFLYDGQKEIGSLDENLAIQELRILGHTPHAEIGGAIAVELQGKVFAPIHDLHGNIAALLPVDGTSPTYYRYSAFGEEQIDGPVLSPWRFSSKRSDASTNLVYYGRRFYMPLLGRWLTPDPAGFTDGMNLYAFVHNDPLTHFDEYGLFGYGQTKSNSWNGIASRSYQTAKETISNTWNDPRFQGSMQAFGGLAEATIGGTMALGTGGIAAPLGWLVMAHGFDQFITGMNTAFSRHYQYSTTNQVLQKTGMSPQTAGLIDGGLSLAGGMGGTAAARFNQITGLQRFHLPPRQLVNRPATSPISAHLLKNKLIAEEIAGGHAFTKHILTQGEFPGWIRTRAQFAKHIENVLNDPAQIKKLRNNREAYWQQEGGTIVIRDPSALDGGTAFQPRNGVIYFLNDVK